MSVALTFPDDFVNASKAVINNENSPNNDWLANFREGQLQQLTQLTMPTRKTEDWRYSSRHLKMSGDIAKPLSALEGSQIGRAHV